MLYMFIAWKWYYRVALCDMSRLDKSLGDTYYFYINIAGAGRIVYNLAVSPRIEWNSCAGRI